MSKIETVEYTRYPKLVRSNFGELVRKRELLREDKKNIEKEIKELDESIELLMIQCKTAKKVGFNEYTVRRADGTNTHIDGKILALNGVKPEVIKKATITKNYTFLDIRERKQDEETEG